MGKLIKVLKLPAVIILAGLCLLVIAASLPVGGLRGLSVQTGSMEPAVRPGDLVLVHKVAADTIQTGDIITFANPQNKRETITHRVKSVIRDGGPIRFITQGDANPMPDLPVYSHQL